MNITNTTGITTNTIDDYVNTAIYLANNNSSNDDDDDNNNNDNNNSNDGDNNDNDDVTNEYKSFFKKLKASKY